MADKRQNRAALVLFFLFFLGLAVTLSALVDLHWTHYVFAKKPATAHLKQEQR
jgi:hypothetical protein